MFLSRMKPSLPLILLCLFVMFTTSTSDDENGCLRPQLADNIQVEGLQMYFGPGAEVVLSCKQGYTPISGPRRIVCAVSGEWTSTRLKCIPKRCPYPNDVSNGEILYEDIIYQSTINFTCYEGYSLIGASSAVCLANGTWSAPVPECVAVTCGLAPIPPNGKFIYDNRVRGNVTQFGARGTYQCRPPFALIGEARAECTVSGNWTKTPECRVVTCPPPENIDRGYLSVNDQRDFDYKETVKYGCHGDYVLEGSQEIVCERNGDWSEKPSCKAPCRIVIERGRILYKGQKIWIENLTPKRVLHKEIISVFCLEQARKCGYAVSAQCIDGRLKIPDCFEEPSGVDYNLYSKSLPSEIQQC